MDAAAGPWPPPVGAYAEERELFRLLQVNGLRPPRGHRGESSPPPPLRSAGAASGRAGGGGGGEGHPRPPAWPRGPPVSSRPPPAAERPAWGAALPPFPAGRPVPGACGKTRAGVPA